MGEGTGLRVFRIEANYNPLLSHAAADLNLAGARARAFWVVTKQDTKYAEECAFKIDRLGLLSLRVGLLCRFHNVPSNYDMETRLAQLEVWTVSEVDRKVFPYRFFSLLDSLAKASTFSASRR